MPLDREQIVNAAIRILDEEGSDALSMRRLGQELDAGTTSVYWHVKGKEQLLDLVVDQIVGEVFDGFEARGDWRAWMTRFARSIRRVLLLHHGVAPMVGRRPVMGPNALAALEDLLAALRADGFDARSAALAATTLVSWASAFAVFEVRDPAGPDATDAQRAAHAADLARDVAAFPPEHDPNTAELMPATVEITADERFDYGLAVLLDGIEARERRGRSFEG
jgi:AcrR family transcriptional regulator